LLDCFLAQRGEGAFARWCGGMVATLLASGNATGAVSIKVTALTEGVIKTMFLTKLKIATVLFLAVRVLVVGAGVLTCSRLGAQTGTKPDDVGPNLSGAETPTAVEKVGDPKTDKELIQGVWQAIEADAGGKHFPWEASTKQQWTISDRQITIRYEDPDAKELVEFSYELGDPDKKPREIDMKYLNGPAKGTAALGIYELNCDRLTISYYRGDKRPAKFEANGEDRSRRYYVLKRIIEDKEKPKPDKEDRLAWGETVNDLQAGVSMGPAGRTAYRIGDTIQFVVKVRNVGKEPRDFSCPSQLFDDHGPVVTDAAGQRLTVKMPPVEFFRRVLEKKTLEPGEVIDLGTPKLVLLPASGKEQARSPSLAASPGTVKVSYPGLAQTPVDGKERENLSTGWVELEIKEAANPRADK
jgi:uncharacterized protein (TIGR03067 family)